MKHTIYRSLFFFLISFTTTFTGIKISSYNLPDEGYNKPLENVKRRFKFSNFMIGKDKIAFKQKIFYVEKNNFFNGYCCLCPDKESTQINQSDSRFIILNLKNTKVSTYKSYSNYQNTLNPESLETIKIVSPVKYSCIGKPLTESIFLEKLSDDTPPEDLCKVYARNTPDTFLIGSIEIDIDFYRKKTKFYLWKTINKESQKLEVIEALTDVDKKADLIVKIFFIAEKSALIFFNDGQIVKLDITSKE